MICPVCRSTMNTVEYDGFNCAMMRHECYKCRYFETEAKDE